MTLDQIASAALAANPGILKRIRQAAPTGQYKAVGTALADVVASKAETTRHKATWALVNASSDRKGRATETVNSDF